MAIKIKQLVIEVAPKLYIRVSQKVFEGEGYFYSPIDPKIEEEVISEMFPIEKSKKKSKVRISPDTMVNTLNNKLGGFENYILNGQEVIESSSTTFFVYRQADLQEIGIVFRIVHNNIDNSIPKEHNWVFMPKEGRDKFAADLRQIFLSTMLEGLEVSPNWISRYLKLHIYRELANVVNINPNSIGALDVNE